MKKWKINQTTCKHEHVFTKRKTQAPGWKKTSPPTPLLKNSTSTNSCSTRMIINPPNLYPPSTGAFQTSARYRLH